MLYKILRFVFRYAVKKYFKEIRLQNATLIPVDKPVIFFPNHRSAFMDPIVVAALVQRPIHFLARGESFKNPIMAKIYSHLNMIPIYRKEFSPDEAHKNEEVFKHCYELLEAKGAIMIFPEGLSQTKPRLLPFKTGAARIALEAEERNRFNLEVAMVPVGINYTNPHRFQSNLFINFGEPILVSNYRELYEKEAFEGVKKLTSDMESALRERIITLDGKRWFDLSEKVEDIVKTEPEAFLPKNSKENFDWFLAKKDINGAIDFLKKSKPELLNQLEERTNAYIQMIERLHVSKQSVHVRAKGYRLDYHLPSILSFLILLAPLFILGFILLAPPFFLTRFIAKKVVSRIDFMGSVVLALGLLLFSIAGFLESWLFANYMGHWIWGVGLFLAIPLLGMFTRKYYIHLLYFSKNKRWLTIDARKERLSNYVVEEKRKLLGLFRESYREYLQQTKGK